ncbi:expressed unknown protein [Ectocarpus siliculosus]|uniref:F-box domain-containing protein n=1 Tax=Ectocarpus siliculosus TaxID=2880 RepID=D7G5J6_ECTSI|nr:expressed unknown protein [Ectocarpus siliculosus]|eukprot:CBJ27319.1 expressed unknown protein [Ectocarpus siliculosus]
MTVSVVGGDEYVCPFLFDFLTISELGRAASVCSTWRTNAADDELWREIYERTQGPWHRRGNSRLSFLGRLHDSLAGQDADGGAAAVSNTPPSTPADSSRGAPAAAEKAGETRSFPDWPRLRHGRWREELKANCCHVPAVELVKLDDHTDEVLDLKFSPDGTRLATCSRDMSILVYAIEAMPENHGSSKEGEKDDGPRKARASGANGGSGGGGGNGVDEMPRDGQNKLRPLGFKGLGVRLIHRLRRSATASVCRIFWSPCGRFILSCLEEPHGNPFIPSSSELWDAWHGQRLSRCRSQPFDVHAAWMPDGEHFVAGLDLTWDETDDTVPYTQTFAIRRRPTPITRGGSTAPASSASKAALEAHGLGGGMAISAISANAARLEQDSIAIDANSARAEQDSMAIDANSTGVEHRGLSSTHEHKRGSIDTTAAALTDDFAAAAAPAEGSNVAGVSKPSAAGGGGGHAEGPSAMGVSEGVGWGEEAMSFSSCLSSSSSTLTLLHLGEAQQSATGVGDPAGGGKAGEGGSAASIPVSATGEVAGIMWVDPGLEGKGSPAQASVTDETAVESGGGPREELPAHDMSVSLPEEEAVAPAGAAAAAASAAAAAPSFGSPFSPPPLEPVSSHGGSSNEGEETMQPWGCLGGDSHPTPLIQYPFEPSASSGGGGAHANGGDGGGLFDLNVGVGIAAVEGGGGGGGGGGGEDEEGGVEWVMQGGEVIAQVDDGGDAAGRRGSAQPSQELRAFFPSNSGSWACVATGDTPMMCHRVAFIPLGEARASPPKSTSTRPAAISPGDPGVSDDDDDGGGSGDDEKDVFIRVLRSGSGGDAASLQPKVTARRMEAVECGGAVLSLSVTRDDRFIMVNVRPFMKGALDKLHRPEGRHTAPEISNEIELQVWDVATKKLAFKLGGHHAFTTKDCPFLIMAAQSAADPFGDYVCSGSEEHRVFVWHLRHRLLLGVLKGHEDVVNSVSWNPKYPGMMSSCSDDGTAIIWGPRVR